MGRSPVVVALSKSSVTAVPGGSVCWFCGSRSLGAVIETPPIAPATAPVLGIAGPAFTLDGRPRFLLLVSYFDALRASDAALEADFAFLRRSGVDGVRIFPNWWRCEAERQCGGHPAPDTLFE